MRKAAALLDRAMRALAENALGRRTKEREGGGEREMANRMAA